MNAEEDGRLLPGLAARHNNEAELRHDTRIAGKPLTAERISLESPLGETLSPGDHILYRLPRKECYRASYHSAIVTYTDEQYISVIENSENGVKERKISPKSDDEIYAVTYTDNCKYSPEEAIERAKMRVGERRYRVLFNNSHFFVTWAKTGRELLMSDILSSLNTRDAVTFLPDQRMVPALFMKNIDSCKDLSPGDHLVSRNEHWLVEEVNETKNTFQAYSWKRGNVIKSELKFECHLAFVVKYDPVAANLRDTQTVIKEAQELFAAQETKFASSDQFVTAMITGKQQSFSTNECMFEKDDPVYNLTKVTPDVSIDEGDHLVLISDTQEYHILVHSVLDNQTLLIAPHITSAEEKSSVHEIWNGELYQITIAEFDEVFRINYEHCLPPDQTIDRALSKPGIEFLQQRSQCEFVSWAKTGSPVDIDLALLKTKPQVIIQKQPIMYERIVSVDEIKEGDHLIESTPFYWFHYMVTEKHSERFSIIYQLRTRIKEIEYAINPKQQKLYRIIYPDSLPAEVAIKNARTRLHDQRDLSRFSVHGRLNFVRWAKTGSTDGIEVQFLFNNSKPTSKSTVVSFAQLEPGDYLVHKEGGSTSVYHHCLVKEVVSPTRCRVYEVWEKSFRVQLLDLEFSTDGHKYFRINYNNGACILTSQTLEMACDMVKSRAKKMRNRRRFVQYVKTLDDSEISVDDLQDDRLLLPRKRVHSVEELKLGDHLEHVGDYSKYVPVVDYQHHMIVSKFENGRYVITERSTKFSSSDIEDREISGGELDKKEVCRILYPETIDPEIGLQSIQEQKEKVRSYHLFKSNCEHLVMLGTVGESISIQVNEVHRKALIVTEKGPIVISKSISLSAGAASIRYVAKSAADATTKGIVRLVVRGAAKGAALEAAAVDVGEMAAFSSFQLGYRAALNGTAVGAVAGIAIGVNLLIEAPLLGYSIYKLERKKKFSQISQAQYKKEVIKSTTKSVNTAAGGIVGAVVGQVAIPVPVLGAAVGGTVGSVVGQLCGMAEGALFSLAVPDKTYSLPAIIVNKFTSIDDIPMQTDFESDRTISSNINI